MRLARVPKLACNLMIGTWFRTVVVSYLTTPLSTGHTRMRASRFHAATIAAGFQILYLTEDHVTALFEVEAILGSPFSSYLPNAAGAFAILPVQVHLQAITDLTLPPTLRSIESSVQELTGDWKSYKHRNPAMTLPLGNATTYRTEVPTQQLGHALFQTSGIEGFVTYSARVSTKRNLVVFSTKLVAGSSVIYHDPATGHVSRIHGA